MNILGAQNVTECVINSASIDSLPSIKCVCRAWYRTVWARYAAIAREFEQCTESCEQLAMCRSYNVEWLSLVDKGLVSKLVRCEHTNCNPSKLVLACAPDDHYIIHSFPRCVRSYHHGPHMSNFLSHALTLISQGRDKEVLDAMISAGHRYDYHNIEILPTLKLCASLAKIAGELSMNTMTYEIAHTLVAIARRIDVDHIYRSLDLPSGECVVTFNDVTVATYGLFDGCLILAYLYRGDLVEKRSSFTFKFSCEIEWFNRVSDTETVFATKNMPDVKSSILNTLFRDFKEKCPLFRTDQLLAAGCSE